MPRKAVVGRKLLLDVVTVVAVNKVTGESTYVQYKLYRPPKDKDKILQLIRRRNTDPEVHIAYIAMQQQQEFKVEQSPETFVTYGTLTPISELKNKEN